MYVLYFFFFNDTATTEIYTLSLHDALPIFNVGVSLYVGRGDFARAVAVNRQGLGLGAVELEGHLLQVKYDVGRVLDDAAYGRELVLDALDLDRRNRRALNRREQRAAEAVADGRAEAALERDRKSTRL